MVVLVTRLFTYEVSGEDRGKPRIQNRLGASPGTRGVTKGRRSIWGGMKKGIEMYHRLQTHIILYVAVPLLLAAVLACGTAATPTQKRVLHVNTVIMKDDADGTFTNIFTGLEAGKVPAYSLFDDFLIISAKCLCPTP